MNPIRKLYADIRIALIAFRMAFRDSRSNTYFRGQRVDIYVLIVPLERKIRRKK
jgi:hypothetical protein